ncbi:TBC domain protein [Dictyocaulus viviparus]|uniref:TBC domain protein n=1 Tax=Dictyocaulus viviparus TaxID=29172 RepID=A0A0D8XEK3_DICVI|nr:TBC domain protein [Dictyocaulus viviparus]
MVKLAGHIALPSSEQTFKKGHIRRSSYESSQIQLNFARQMTTQHNTSVPTIEQCSVASLCSSHTESNVACGSSASSSDANDYDCIAEKSFSIQPVQHSFKQHEESAKGVLSRFPRLFSRNGSGKSWFFGKEKKESVLIRTTGLILEERPSSLPAKPSDEAARHKQLYYGMIGEMKKKEQRAQKELRQAQFEKVRLEEQAKTACYLWMEKILPNWNEARNTKRCHELWWQGIPPKIRGQVWSLVIGNELHITPELYELNCTKAACGTFAGSKSDQCCDNAGQNEYSTLHRENSLSQIRLDIARTFPSLGFFQEDGPYYGHLMKLLGAYACFRPSVGYLQSMAFIAAVLLLQMDLYPAFVAFANLLNRPLQTAFFEFREAEMTKYFVAYDRYMEQELPDLHHHLDKLDVRPDLYLIEWIYTLYAKSLPLDITCRIWDVYLRDGEEFIFQTALGILRMYESQLLTMDFDECVEFLTQLPVKMSCVDLFRNIEPLIRTHSSAADISRSRKGFLQIFNDIEQHVNQGEPNVHDVCSRNLKEIKMSKSLSGFVNDLLSTAK